MMIDSCGVHKKKKQTDTQASTEDEKPTHSHPFGFSASTLFISRATECCIITFVQYSKIISVKYTSTHAHTHARTHGVYTYMQSADMTPLIDGVQSPGSAQSGGRAMAASSSSSTSARLQMNPMLQARHARVSCDSGQQHSPRAEASTRFGARTIGADE